jgi:hypothetical protein
MGRRDAILLDSSRWSCYPCRLCKVARPTVARLWVELPQAPCARPTWRARKAPVKYQVEPQHVLLTKRCERAKGVCRRRRQTSEDIPEIVSAVQLQLRKEGGRFEACGCRAALLQSTGDANAVLQRQKAASWGRDSCFTQGVLALAGRSRADLSLRGNAHRKHSKNKRHQMWVGRPIRSV